MQRSRILPLAMAAMAVGTGMSSDRGDAVTVTAGEKHAADTMRVPRGIPTRRKSPGAIASKKRRSRRRGG